MTPEERSLSQKEVLAAGFPPQYLIDRAREWASGALSNGLDFDRHILAAELFRMADCMEALSASQDQQPAAGTAVAWGVIGVGGFKPHERAERYVEITQRADRLAYLREFHAEIEPLFRSPQSPPPETCKRCGEVCPECNGSRNISTGGMIHSIMCSRIHQDESGLYVEVGSPLQLVPNSVEIAFTAWRNYWTKTRPAWGADPLGDEMVEDFRAELERTFALSSLPPNNG